MPVDQRDGLGVQSLPTPREPAGGGRAFSSHHVPLPTSTGITNHLCGKTIQLFFPNQHEAILQLSVAYLADSRKECAYWHSKLDDHASMANPSLPRLIVKNPQNSGAQCPALGQGPCCLQKSDELL